MLIPMQPRPMAETSRLPLPSLRFCIFRTPVFRLMVGARRLVLVVANLFHPVGAPAVELFDDGDVRHGRGGRGAVPMLLAGRNPDHVARPYFFQRTAPALYLPAAGRHDQGLAQWVGVPCRPGAGLEGDAG